MDLQNEEPKRKPSVKEYIREQFEAGTTVQGIPHMLKHKYRCMTIFWLIVVLACVGVMVFQSYSLFDKFFYQHLIKTVFQEGKGKPVFPDVTICNLYPLTKNGPVVMQDSYLTWFQYQNIINQYFLYNGTKHSESEIYDFYDKVVSTDFRFNYYDVTNNPSTYFANFPILDHRDENFTQTTNLISDCTFLNWLYNSNTNATCNQSNREVVWNANYYACYTFKVPDSERRNVRALSAILYIDNFPQNVVNSISPDMTESGVGVLAVVHSPGTVPDFNSGISIGPGTASTISISVTERTRLNKPYSPDGCSNEEYLTDLKKYRYSYEICLDVCKQQQIVDQCECLSPDFHFTESQKLQAHSRVCGNMSLREYSRDNNLEINDEIIDDIFDSFEKYPNHIDLENDILQGLLESFCSNTIPTFDEFSTNCTQCLLPCNETTYETSVSTSPWPHLSRQLTFYKKYILDRDVDNSLNNSYGHIYEKWNGNFDSDNGVVAIEQLKIISGSKIEDNFLKIKFVLDSPHPFTLTESQEYTWDSFLGELGGALGVWLGITVITFVEFIDLLISSAALYYSHVATKPKKNPELVEVRQINSI